MGGRTDGGEFRRRFSGRGRGTEEETKDDRGSQGQRREAPCRLVQDAWWCVDWSTSTISVTHRLRGEHCRRNSRRDCRKGHVQDGTAERRDSGVEATTPLDLGMGDEYS